MADVTVYQSERLAGQAANFLLLVTLFLFLHLNRAYDKLQNMSDNRLLLKARYMGCVFFFFSGLAALIYEIIWVRILGLVFGNTTYAVSTVLAVFMAGLGIGSYLVGRYADTCKAKQKITNILLVLKKFEYCFIWKTIR